MSILHLSFGFDIYVGVMAFVLGACMGSFLNCMAYRIAQGESVLKGRSHCDTCGHVLSVRDLFPIVSFLISKGKCRYCGARLSAGHLVAEIATGITFVLIIFTFDLSWTALEMTLFACVLLVAAFSDIKSYIIPNGCIIAGIILRIPFFFLLPDWQACLIDALLGGFAVGGGLLLIVLIYERVRKVEAMGGGDLKLLFVTGLYLGFAQNILCVFIACILGIIFGLIFQHASTQAPQASGDSAASGSATPAITSSTHASSTPAIDADTDTPKIFPWGPSISAAAILCALFGTPLISLYLALF